MLEMKPSMFNLVVETQENGAILLFNTFTTALCLISKETQQFLSEAQYEINELSSDARKTIEQFSLMGFIVDQSLDEISRLELMQNFARYGNRNLTLTIGPSMACNMCCPYCFEAERHGVMTQETAEKLIQFVENYIATRKIELVNVTWYGGEPLLGLNRIEQISKALISYCEERNVSYSAMIITNGYLMDQSSANLLKSLKVTRAQITIDGLEETHNARRKLKSGDGSFWPIVRNIESAKNILPIVVRVNVDEANVQEMDALTDFFINDMKWGVNPRFYLAPVEKFSENCDADFLSMQEFSSMYQSILTRLYEKGIEITKNNYPSYTNTGCASICANSYVIDANGFFYTCWNHFGEPSHCIGSLDEPNKIGMNGDYFRWLTIPIPDKCKKCVYLPICQSGCPDQRIQNQNQPICRSTAFMCISNLKLTYRNYIKEKTVIV